ncbi:hypothetical protein LCGC14_2668220, partial [marine sediment metagenome]
MARNRMIKPDFWEDEKIGELNHRQRLLFIGMWNHADDEGLIRAKAEYLKSMIFVYDDFLIEKTEEDINQLAKLELIFLYSGTLNQRYAYVINFRKHQKIDRPQKSKLPPPSIQNNKVKDMYYARGSYLCYLCELPVNMMDSLNICQSMAPSIDHIIPKVKGGSDYPTNIACAHISCNKSKGNLTLKEFKERISSKSSSSNDSSSDSLSGSVTKEKVKEKVKEKEKQTKENPPPYLGDQSSKITELAKQLARLSSAYPKNGHKDFNVNGLIQELVNKKIHPQAIFVALSSLAKRWTLTGDDVVKNPRGYVWAIINTTSGNYYEREHTA